MREELIEKVHLSQRSKNRVGLITIMTTHEKYQNGGLGTAVLKYAVLALKELVKAESVIVFAED